MKQYIIIDNVNWVINENENGEITDIERLYTIRLIRNQLLTDTDKYMLVDKYELLTDEQKIAIKTYRQELRDLPEIVNVNNPIFPVKPI